MPESNWAVWISSWDLDWFIWHPIFIIICRNIFPIRHKALKYELGKLRPVPSFRRLNDCPQASQ